MHSKQKREVDVYSFKFTSFNIDDTLMPPPLTQIFLPKIVLVKIASNPGWWVVLSHGGTVKLQIASGWYREVISTQNGCSKFTNKPQHNYRFHHFNLFFFLYQIWHSLKSQEVYDLLFSCMPLTAVILSDGLVNRQGWICVGGCTCHMYHPTPTMIVMVVLLCLPGIRYVCAASESDKRDSECGVRAPGEHRGHWWCWASDRKAEIQGWSHQIAQQDSNTLQMIHKSFNILMGQRKRSISLH